MVQAARSVRLNRRWRIISTGSPPSKPRLVVSLQTGRSGSGPGCPSPGLNRRLEEFISSRREVGARKKSKRKGVSIYKHRHTRYSCDNIYPSTFLGYGKRKTRNTVSLLTRVGSFRSAGFFLPSQAMLSGGLSANIRGCFGDPSHLQRRIRGALHPIPFTPVPDPRGLCGKGDGISFSCDFLWK